MSDDFMSRGDSNPAFKFTNIGDTAIGTVLSYDKVEDRDFRTGEILTWPNGDIRYFFKFQIETADEGVRPLYVKSNMEKAIKDAGHLALVKTVVGCHLHVEYTGNGVSKTKGFIPPKLYTAKVTPAPPSRVTADDLLG